MNGATELHSCTEQLDGIDLAHRLDPAVGVSARSGSSPPASDRDTLFDPGGVAETATRARELILFGGPDSRDAPSADVDSEPAARPVCASLVLPNVTTSGSSPAGSGPDSASASALYARGSGAPSAQRC